MIKDASSISALTRSGRAGAVVILVAVALNASLVFMPKPAFLIAVSGHGLLFILALVFRDPMAVHVTMLTFLSAVWGKIWPSFWPFYLLGPLVIYAMVVAIIPRLRQTTSWLRLGQFDRVVWWLVGLTIFISSFGLLLWFILWQPNLSRWLTILPSWNPMLLIPVGLGFALVNAAIEEAVYRGILMQGLDAALGASNIPVILQAISFGLLHLNGVPGGWCGIAMATVYGLMLGLLKRRAQGMLAPFVAHVFADVVIFTILVLFIPSSPPE
ncbi:CPBP family intramembrane metalloprotease [Candidatus Poribacteria bacterium]|nr:CPBP family intramembrane metalloprotease [Candidatus Poribacteria bacterium]